ncbi:hypothetical protein, partial [Porphyromonas loveana]|uniref:hypothetical protein n=1 Tax=Porphyromonas loveana TaxID=1884669 RepID=UPI00359F7D36
SCIVQEGIVCLCRSPASCRKQETAYDRVLHRAGSKKQPTITLASCREQETAYNHVLHRAGSKKAFLFRLNSCIFTLQWKD